MTRKACASPGSARGSRSLWPTAKNGRFPSHGFASNHGFVDGRVEIGGGPSFGPEFDDKLDILFGVAEADPAERLRVKFEVAVRLLAANYNLEPDNFAELIVLEPGDPVSEERWEQLCNAIMGIAPKPSPAI